MERLKSITIIFLLAVGLLASAASAKPASVLLQEGLYAEEIEGDLDAAIKIYEQVIAEAKETQRAAAQATYRIGVCLLKKGDKAKAAEQFRNLISKYPEHKTLVARALEQVTKLGPAVKGGFDYAESVPVDQLIKSGKVPSFKTQVYDNTGLDLETGLSMAFIGEWPALYDVAWDNDGGGALMIKPRSSVRFLALGAAEKWEDAISMARNSLDVLRTSTSKGMFASQSKFAAVLTCEGNLAVIQIGEYDANKGTIYVWIEYIHIRGFGPVMERVINDDGEEKHCLIDFDTGRLYSHSTEIRSEEAILRWIAENRIDAMGDTRTSGPGLYGFDMAVIPIAAETWETISPEGLVDVLSIAKGGTPALMSAVGNLPVTYIFKTREGGMGIVQILEMQHNKKPRHFRIRYKMLQVETAQFRVQSHKVFLPECDTTVYDLLDLASNKIINSEPGGELIDLRDPAGKGNLYFDRSRGSDYLACVRGTRMQLRNGGELLLSEPNFISHGRNAYYPIVEIPCQYLVTTAQGDKYELKVLSVMTSEKPSIEIEYWKSAESPEAFAVATGVRGDAAKAMELLSGLKALMAGIVGAIESDDPNTALLLLDKLIGQSKQFKPTVKDTSVEAAVNAGLEVLDGLRDALEKKQMGRAKSLLATLNQMGPAIESAIEKESAGRIVFLPDADDVIQQGKVAVVLDLTTGKMLPGNKDKQYFNKLNKGDVAYFDDEGKDLLVCFRGAKITRKTANGKYYDTPDQSHTDNTVHIYIIKKTPAEWTITTKEGDIYELKVLSLDNDQAKIKYRKMPALEKKTSIDEKLRSAFIACGTLCDSIRNALDDDDFETAEALCKEVEKHLAKGLELTPQSELGPMLESLAVQFKIWHEAIKAKDKEKAIRLGEALNHAGGLISDFVLEEKPDTHK